MKDLTKTLATIFAVALLIWAVGFTAPKLIDIYKNKPVEKVDTVYYSDTLYFERTVTDTLPEYRYETIVKRDTLYKWKAKGDSVEKIPRVVTLKKKDYSKEIPLGNDTIEYSATITGWSVDNDSMPMLDSIRFTMKGYSIKDKEVITNTIIKQQKAKKWHIGVQAGYGYGFNSKQVEPFIGIGVSYSIF